MTYVKIDDAEGEDDRTLALTDKAFRLHYTAKLSCSRNLTDGVISEQRLATLRAQTKATQRHVNELVLAGLWEGDGPWKIVGYLDLNSTKEHVEHVREERREAGRRGGQASAQSRMGSANVEQIASPALEPIDIDTDRENLVGAEARNGRLDPERVEVAS